MRYDVLRGQSECRRARPTRTTFTFHAKSSIDIFLYEERNRNRGKIPSTRCETRVLRNIPPRRDIPDSAEKKKKLRMYLHSRHTELNGRGLRPGRWPTVNYVKNFEHLSIFLRILFKRVYCFRWELYPLVKLIRYLGFHVVVVARRVATFHDYFIHLNGTFRCLQFETLEDRSHRCNVI